MLGTQLDRALAEAAEASTRAAGCLPESRGAGNVSGQYLASASGKFEQRRVRVVAFAFAAAIFAFAIVRTAMLPL